VCPGNRAIGRGNREQGGEVVVHRVTCGAAGGRAPLVSAGQLIRSLGIMEPAVPTASDDQIAAASPSPLAVPSTLPVRTCPAA
jgi:hypothetical protein